MLRLPYSTCAYLSKPKSKKDLANDISERND